MTDHRHRRRRRPHGATTLTVGICCHLAPIGSETPPTEHSRPPRITVVASEQPSQLRHRKPFSPPWRRPSFVQSIPPKLHRCRPDRASRTAIGLERFGLPFAAIPRRRGWLPPDAAGGCPPHLTASTSAAERPSASTTEQHAEEESTSPIADPPNDSHHPSVIFETAGVAEVPSGNVQDDSVVDVGGVAWRIRTAHPDEIDSLSRLVAQCFVPPPSTIAREGDNDGKDDNGARQLHLLSLTSSLIASWMNKWKLLEHQWERSLTRYTVYAGMVQRLVVGSYMEGKMMATSRSSLSGEEDQYGGRGEGWEHPLFVAELVVSAPPSPHDGIDRSGDGPSLETAITSTATPPIASNMIGVAELAYGPCPVPFPSPRDDEKGAPRDTTRFGDDRVAPFVCNLAVHPQHRNRGVGRALLRRVERAAADDAGFASSSSASASTAASDATGAAVSTTDSADGGEIWLETGYSNVPALRMYLEEGYVCEGVDPAIRGDKHRRSFFRKRLGLSEEGSDDGVAINGAVPEYGRNVLSLVRLMEGEGSLEEVWTARYDIDGDGEEDGAVYVGEMSYLERNFGTLAPIVAAVGTVVGIILF